MFVQIVFKKKIFPAINVFLSVSIGVKILCDGFQLIIFFTTAASQNDLV